LILDETTIHSSGSGNVEKSSASSSSSASSAAAAAKRDPLALHNAAYESNLELMKHLIEEGADINYRDKNNWTPLHCCSSTGQLAMCELLLAQKVPNNNTIISVIYNTLRRVSLPLLQLAHLMMCISRSDISSFYPSFALTTFLLLMLILTSTCCFLRSNKFLAHQSITVTGIFAVNNDGNTALHYLVRMHPKEKDVEQYLRVLRQIVDKVKHSTFLYPLLLLLIWFPLGCGCEFAE
jgi:hypothetical protein